MVGGACKSTANIIVLDPTDGNIATISTKHWNTLNTLITPWTTTSTTISAPSDLFYNSHGAKKPGDDPNESKVRILSKCVETSNVAPPDSKKKTIKAYLWIVPTAMLLLLVVMALIYWIYLATRGLQTPNVGNTVSNAAGAIRDASRNNKGITVLSIGLLICIVFIVILSVMNKI